MAATASARAVRFPEVGGVGPTGLSRRLDIALERTLGPSGFSERPSAHWKAEAKVVFLAWRVSCRIHTHALAERNSQTCIAPVYDAEVF